jgi:hypothetical protein
MPIFKWILTGGLAAGAAVLLWVLAAMFADAPLGWLACVVGLVVGLAVRRTAVPRDAGTSAALLAVFITVGAIMGAKYAIASALIEGQFRAVREYEFVDEETMIATVADEVVLEYQEQNRPVQWPDEEMTWEDALWEEDYPPEIWQEATRRWQELSPTERSQRTAEHRGKIERIIETHVVAPRRGRAFRESFGSWDVLWIGMAVVLAFSMGRGPVDS